MRPHRPICTPARRTSCPRLMDRVVVELNELRPDIVLCTGDLTEMGFRQDYLTAQEYPGAHRVPAARRDPRQPRRAQRRLRALRGAHRPALDRCCNLDDVTIVAVDSTRAGPRPRADRAGALRLAQGAVLPSRPRFRIFMLHHHLLPVPGHRARAQHRLRRRRPPRGAAGLRRQPRALRAQARAVRVAARAACSWSTPAPAASLRLRGNTKACYNIVRLDGDRVRGGAQVPLPRHRDAHRLRAVVRGRSRSTSVPFRWRQGDSRDPAARASS